MTTVYLMRHSKGNIDRNYLKVKESFQIQNEKYILSVEGEQRAKKYSELPELQDIDFIVSSNYVRSISTAKYISEINDLPLYIDEDFNERKFGIENIKKLPKNFFEKQMEDKNYKLSKGESREEVRSRMVKGLIRVMKGNLNKKIVIVSHASSIAFLLTKWCDVRRINGKYIIKYKGATILNGFDSPELLRLEFDEKNKLINIKNIRIKELEYDNN